MVRTPPPIPDVKQASLARLEERLHTVVVRIIRHARVMDRTRQHHWSALATLATLVHQGPMSLSQLALIQHVRAPTMTRQSQRLRRAGLVAITRDPADRRRRRVSATAAGRRYARVGRGLAGGLLGNLLHGWTIAELHALRRAITLLDRALARG